MCLLNWFARRVETAKYPRITVQFTSRTIPNFGPYPIDVRAFFVNPVSQELQDIIKPIMRWSDDEKAHFLRAWVETNIRYASDKATFKVEEFWQYPSETLKTKLGDCDDGAILLANLLAAALPRNRRWKVRLAAGFTADGVSGHLYVTYFCLSTGQWVALDWCYVPSDAKIENLPDYKDSGLYGDVWFSFDNEHAYAILERLE